MSGDNVGSSNITLGLSVDNASLIQSTSTIVNAIEQITETIRVSNQNNRLVAVNDEDIAAITESYNTRITLVNNMYEAEASAIRDNSNLSSQERERAATESRSNHQHAIRFLEEQRLKAQEALVQASPRATSQQSLAFKEVPENWQAVDATNQSLASYRQIESVLNGIAASEKSRMTDAELAERRSTDRIADINRSYQARILALGNVNALMNSEERSALVLVEIERQRAVVAIEQESSRKALLAVDKQLESAAYSRMTAEERILATAVSQIAIVEASGATDVDKAAAYKKIEAEEAAANAALKVTEQTKLEESAKRNLLAVEKELNAAEYSRLDALGKIAATAASRTAAVDASGATDVDKDVAKKKIQAEEAAARAALKITEQTALEESAKRNLLGVEKEIEAASYSRLDALGKIAATADRQRAVINSASGATDAQRVAALDLVNQEEVRAITLSRQSAEQEKLAAASRVLLGIEKEIEAASYSRLDALGKIAATAASRTATVDASGATDVDKDVANKKIQAEEAAAIAALARQEQAEGSRVILGVEQQIAAAVNSRMTAEEKINAIAVSRAAIIHASGADPAEITAALQRVAAEKASATAALATTKQTELEESAKRTLLGVQKEIEAAAYSRLTAEEKIAATAASQRAAINSTSGPNDEDIAAITEQYNADVEQVNAAYAASARRNELAYSPAYAKKLNDELELLHQQDLSIAENLRLKALEPIYAKRNAALDLVDEEERVATAALATTKQTELEESAKRTLLGVQKEIEAAAYSRLTVEQKIFATADRQRAAIDAVLGATNAQKDAAKDIVDQEGLIQLTLLRQSVEKEKIAEASRNLLAVEKEIEAAAYSRLDAEGKIAATAASRVASIRASGATPAQQDAAITRVDNEQLEATTELHRRNAVQLQEQLNSRYLNSLPTLERIQKYHEKNIEQINRQIALTHQERDALIQTANQLRDNQLQKAGQGHSSSEQADRTRNQMMQEFGRGFEDFVVSASMAKTTTEGLAMGLRGAANNISQMAAASGAFVGAIVAVGVSLATVLVPMAIRFVESFHEALESVDEFKQRLTKGAESEGKHVERQQELDKIGTSGTGKDAESQMKKSIDLLKEKLLAQQAVSKNASEAAVLADKNLKEEEKKLKETNDSYLVLGVTHQALTNYGLYKKPIDEVDNPARRGEGNTAFERSEPAAVVLDLALSPITGAFVAANAFGQWFANTAPKVDDAIAKKTAANELAEKSKQKELEITKHIADIEAHAIEIKNAGAVKYLEELNKQRDKELEKSEFGKVSLPAIKARQEKELSDFTQLTGSLKDPKERIKKIHARNAMLGRHEVELAKATVYTESAERKRDDLTLDRGGDYSDQGPIENTSYKRESGQQKELYEHHELMLKQQVVFKEREKAIYEEYALTNDLAQHTNSMDMLKDDKAINEEMMKHRELTIRQKHSMENSTNRKDQDIAKRKFEKSFDTKAEREKYEGADKILEDHLKNEKAIRYKYIENASPEDADEQRRKLYEANDKQRDRKLAADEKMQKLNEREKTTEEGIDLTKKRMDESGKDTGPTKAFVVGTQDSDKAINRALSGTRTQEDTLKASLKIQQDTLKAIQKEKKALVASV